MSFGRCTRWSFALALALFGSCAGGSSSSGSNSISSVLQDLSLDPEGLTTVVSFMDAPGNLSTANFQCDDGQVAQSVAISGNDATVVWDSVVTPSSRVRVVGTSAIDHSYVTVATSDNSAPTFTITGGSMGTGWGNDEIDVQFAGPHVQQVLAEDLTKWQLQVSNQAMDLTGSTFSFDSSSQTLTIVTGPNANLHATYKLKAVGVKSVADVALSSVLVNGTASGDSSAPTLVSAVQNLSADDLGRVVDFTFSESMDPVFCPLLANFGGQGSDLSVDATMTAEDTIEVTFNNPIVPGVDTVDLLNLMDAHGNLLGTQNTAITAGSTAPNAFSVAPTLNTVANAGGDYVQASFDQALDPDEAEDASHWNLEVPTGTPVDLSTATLSFDLQNKVLTITLASDYTNGTSFSFGPVNGNEPHDVDGDLFTDSVAGTISGDVTPPTVPTVTQNRNLDSTGATLDVAFSEDVDPVSSGNAANFSVSGGASVSSATLLPSGNIVRLVCDQLVVPGDDTVTVSGISDLAGNAMAAPAVKSVVSTDTTPPAPTSASANAIEGASNDTLVVSFNDDLIPSEVTAKAHWLVESPVGTSLSTANATVSYNQAARTATLTFAGSDNQNFKRDQSFKVHFTTMRDLGGNTIAATPVTGTVTAETTLPMVDSVWVENAFANVVHVRFTEPCDLMDDLSGNTIYRVYDNQATFKGSPVSAVVDADELGVALTFGFAVSAGSDTLDVFGVTDLAGNYQFPALLHAIEAEDTGEPTLTTNASVATSVSGEDNDTFTATFDRRPSRWNLLKPSNWTLTDGVNNFDLSNSHFSFDGVDTVTIRLDGHDHLDLQTGASYQLTLGLLTSAQGVALSSPSSDSTTCIGDSTSPTLPLGKARLDAADASNSVLIEMDEAISLTDAADETLVDINGTNPDTALWIGPRAVLATWSGGVTAGDTLNVAYHDLAGNLGMQSRAIAAIDGAGPLVSSVNGVAVADRGGDTIHVIFNKPVDLTSAENVSNYTAKVNNVAFSLTGASATYISASNEIVLHLPSGSELTHGAALNLHVTGVKDNSGNVMNPAANINGAIGGDSTPAAFTSAFVNWRESSNGDVVEVLFSEDVDEAFAAQASNWSSTTGLSVLSVVEVTPKQYRLTMNLPPVSTDDLELVDIPDQAKNLSGTIQTTIIVP